MNIPRGTLALNLLATGLRASRWMLSLPKNCVRVEPAELARQER